MTPALRISRVIAADRERVFAAFVEPQELRKWWGPPGVECTHAVVDATLGGRYRIDNRLPDGNIVTIQGEFTVFERPLKLSYTWSVTPGTSTDPEQVTITFEVVSDGTLVTITHERIEDDATRKSHLEGWQGCLDGLEGHVLSSAARL